MLLFVIDFIAELSRAKRAQPSTMGKKIWQSMHPRNFGAEKIVPTEYVRMYVHPFM